MVKSNDEIKWWVATLATPVAVALLPIVYNLSAEERVKAESAQRLHIELVNKREEADTNLRRELFAKLMDKYLDPGHEIDRRLVVLDLLVQNFGESLALGPLFRSLDDGLTGDDKGMWAAQRSRLWEIAFAARRRQLDVLQLNGAVKQLKTKNIDFDSEIFEADFIMQVGAERRRRGCRFKVSLDTATEPRAYTALLEAVPLTAEDGRTIDASDSCNKVDQGRGKWTVLVDAFAFPLIDYVRLTKTDRFAMYFDEDESGVKTFTFVYFSHAFAGVRDKPYVDALLGELSPPYKR